MLTVRIERKKLFCRKTDCIFHAVLFVVQQIKLVLPNFLQVLRRQCIINFWNSSKTMNSYLADNANCSPLDLWTKQHHHLLTLFPQIQSQFGTNFIHDIKMELYCYYPRIANLQANLCLYESLLSIKLYWIIFPRFIQFVFKWVDRLGMYDFFWDHIPGFDRSEVEKKCLQSCHAIFGCF